jgi:hypothetical protein
MKSGKSKCRGKEENKSGSRLTLHLTDHQLFIEPVCPSQEEKLAPSGLEEFLAQPDEPIFPKRFRFGQVRSPNPSSRWIGRVLFFSEKRRN